MAELLRENRQRWLWVLFGLVGLAWIANITLIEAWWPDLPIDHSVFWAAGLRMLDGTVPIIYDPTAHSAFQAELFGNEEPKNLAYPYPPGSLLFVWLLGLLPFYGSWVAYLLPAISAFYYIIQRLLDKATALAMCFAIGGPIYTIQLGQNGFYTAALLGGGLLALRHNKFAAGIALGLLTLKPQFAPLAFLILLFWREWKALGIAIMTAAALIIIPTLLFGLDIWFAYLAGNEKFVAELNQPWNRVIPEMHQSVYAMFIDILGKQAAMVVQITVALIAIGAALTIKARDQAIAGVIAATLLISPFQFVYDSTALFIATAILIRKDVSFALPMAVALGLIGIWFIAMTSLVPIAAAVILVTAILSDRTERQQTQKAEAA